mmetsp:Transcript_15140/g.41897  ORF Transcript_15140/g.41897 Transcript_15140/m.41897 type:complete len:203 (+) Transcript_15140:321-929(+)
MRDDTILGNQRETLSAWHHRGLHDKSKRLGQFGVGISEEHDSSIGTTRFSAPCSHDERIVGCDADGEIDTLGLEFILCLHEGWEVGLGAAWGEGTWHTEDGDLLSGDQLGDVIVLVLEISQALCEGDGRDLVSCFDFSHLGFDAGCKVWTEGWALGGAGHESGGERKKCEEEGQLTEGHCERERVVQCSVVRCVRACDGKFG